MKSIKITWAIILFCGLIPINAQIKTDRWIEKVSRKLKATIYLDSINEDFTFFAQSKRSKLWGYGQYTEKKANLYIPIEYQELTLLQSDVFAAKKDNSYGLIKTHYAENNSILVPFNFTNFLYDEQCKVMGSLKMRNTQGKWGMLNLRNGMLMAPFWFGEPENIPNIYFHTDDSIDVEQNELWNRILNQNSAIKLLNLSGQRLLLLHPDLEKFSKITEINLDGNNLSQIPKWFGQLKLTSLNLFGNTHNRFIPHTINQFQTLKILKFGWHTLHGSWPVRSWYETLEFDTLLFGSPSIREIHCNHYCTNKENQNHIFEFLKSLPNLSYIRFYRESSLPHNLIHTWASADSISTVIFDALLTVTSSNTIIDDISKLNNIKHIQFSCIDSLNLKPLRSLTDPRFVQIKFYKKIEENRYGFTGEFSYDNTYGNKTHQDFIDALDNQLPN
jgi:hypothetical protein